ncbi:MAG: endonuclease [Candidatus Marinimicrobia bacterium]|nr:endonuclease [Candidatus Neomarinimicrobiota bacterium]
MITPRIFFACFLLPAVLMTAVPPGYYDNAGGKIGDELRLALHNIIDGHTQLTYDDVWDAFATTDLRGNDTIWDMYTGIEFIYGEDQSTGSDVYTTYNREHSWPKSWANESYPMYTDVFHLYPVQAYSNSHRSNLPYGEVGASVSYTTENGTKKGDARDGLGYSGTVFEPIDEYKGDLARTYFYISTRYYTEDGAWDVPGMTDKCELKDWAVDMLLDWHRLDPVSQKELDRNEAVYALQGNRNPFIDEPAYADSVWDAAGGEDPGTPGAAIDSTKIFFSEHTEGSSYNKAIEIYNHTDTVIDLSLLELRLYSNGSLTPGSTLTLSSSLAAGEVFVVAHGSAGAEILAEADMTSGGVTNFNGNDAIELYYNASLIDLLGEVGSDAVFAKDVTLVRKASILHGNRTYTSAEWDRHAQDEFAYLGSHFVESDDPLPVTLLDFSAEVSKGSVILHWATACETENAAFRVHRNDSLLARIPGAGTHSEIRHYEYTDPCVIPEKHYTYVLSDVDYQGRITFLDTLRVRTGAPSAEGQPLRSFAAGEVYPNPFNPAAVFPFHLNKAADISLTLYDMRGKPIRDILKKQHFSAGEQHIALRFQDLAAGIYILQLSDGKFRQARKIVLLK